MPIPADSQHKTPRPRAGPEPQGERETVLRPSRGPAAGGPGIETPRCRTRSPPSSNREEPRGFLWTAPCSDSVSRSPVRPRTPRACTPVCDHQAPRSPSPLINPPVVRRRLTPRCEAPWHQASVAVSPWQIAGHRQESRRPRPVPHSRRWRGTRRWTSPRSFPSSACRARSVVSPNQGNHRVGVGRRASVPTNDHRLFRIVVLEADRCRRAHPLVAGVSVETRVRQPDD